MVPWRDAGLVQFLPPPRFRVARGEEVGVGIAREEGANDLLRAFANGNDPTLSPRLGLMFLRFEQPDILAHVDAGALHQAHLAAARPRQQLHPDHGRNFGRHMLNRLEHNGLIDRHHGLTLACLGLIAPQDFHGVEPVQNFTRA